MTATQCSVYCDPVNDSETVTIGSVSGEVFSSGWAEP